MPIQSWNIEEAGEQAGEVSPHASTHSAGEDDAITPEAIGAEVAGTAQSLITTHLNQANPHLQYRQKSETIPWDQITNKPAGSAPPVANFVPFSDGAWTVINGGLPSLINISDPPAGNNGLPCYRMIAPSTIRQSLWQVPSQTTNYKITMFGRNLAPNAQGVTLGFYRVGSGGAISMTPSYSLILSSAWQQFEVNVSLSLSTTTMIALAITANGGIIEVYGPQLSIAS